MRGFRQRKTDNGASDGTMENLQLKVSGVAEIVFLLFLPYIRIFSVFII